jgi:hypothetical protein
VVETEQDHVKVRKSRATLATAGILTAVVVGGGASLAAASDGTSADAATTKDAADPTFAGSVRAPAEQNGQEVPGDQQQAALQELATVSPQQAEEAALSAVPGTVADTDLDEENGFVLYSVEVNGSNGTVTEVTVDAGGAEVLARQAQDASDSQD